MAKVATKARLLWSKKGERKGDDKLRCGAMDVETILDQ
jgi:hypothetical protein